MKNLIGLSKEELAAELSALGEKPFRAKQLWQWIYFRGENDFDKMSNLSKDLRAKLKENYTLRRPKIVAEQLSKDKTRKWLLEFDDGQRIETVYIPEEEDVGMGVELGMARALGKYICVVIPDEDFGKPINLMSWGIADNFIKMSELATTDFNKPSYNFYAGSVY